MARVTHRCLSPTQGPRDAGSRGAGQAADSPLHPINVNDPDHLEEGQEDQVQGRGVLVEDLQPVAPRPQREAGGHEEAQQAGQAWTRPVRRLRCPPVCLAPRPGGHPWGPCGTQCPPMLPGPRRVSLSCRDHPLSPRGGGSSDVQRGGLAVHSPVSTSLGTLLGMTPRSRSGVMMLSMFPNMDDRPRLKSIPKKSTAQTGAPGMWSTASVKTMKARPVPEALCNTAQVCRHAPGTHACASIPPGTHACASMHPGHVCASMPLGHTHVPAFPPGHTRVPAGATPGRTPTLTLPAGRPGRPPGSGRGDPASSGPCYHILRVHLCREVPCPLNHLRRGTRAPGVGAQEPIQQFPAGACPPPATVPAPHRLAVAWLGAVLTPLSLDSGQPQGPLSPSGPHLQSRACQRSCV